MSDKCIFNRKLLAILTMKNFILSYFQYLRDMGEESIFLPVLDKVDEITKGNGNGEVHLSSPVSKSQQLDDFRDEIKNCQKCSLAKTRTNFVFGVGNPDAKIMFIGEAPGGEEDKLGIPFVGRAGKLLDRILEAVGMRRGDVYIANVLKCRPPENRDPLPVEIDVCLPYLLRQIEIINPKIICCLGRISAGALLKTKLPMNKLRGQVYKFRGIPLVITYHPAAILRNESLKRPVWEDFQLMAKLMRELCVIK